MSKRLSVFLFDSLVGELTQDKHGRVSFTYKQSWLESDSFFPLSNSLPPREAPFEGKECQGFFAGVLPEEENRKIISSILGISSQNDFALLEQIGGECAGAVTFLPVGTELPRNEASYQRFDEAELAEILRELPKRPLMAGHKDVRLSLAGAQNKLAVCIDGGGISLPLQNAPSTHILKPAIARFEGVVQNEYFCMELARKAGLPTANVSTGSCEGMEYLLAERYDRYHGATGQLERLHQEDFCQALGLPPHLKYQNEGGPSLEQSFALIRDVSTAPAPDLLHLLDAITFNYMIGNNDAHGKNFSFLYRKKSGNDTASLAPLYDLISTSAYSELSPKMAMKIGSKYLPHQVKAKHWEGMWEAADFPQNAAQKRTLRFCEKLLRILTDSSHSHSIEEQIIASALAKGENLKALLS